MDELNASYLDVGNYPHNLISSNRYKYQLEEYRTRLERDAKRLFCNERKAKVIILQLEEGRKVFESREVTTSDAVEEALRMRNKQGWKDPICRFVFFYAPNSRDNLFTTREMFAKILTCHQVMPEFLDFIFPFGKREHAEDFYFGALKIDDRSSIPPSAVKIQELGRSGRQYQLCYNLRCVEPYNADDEWPWSIRQCSIFHSFDIENGRTVWLTIKGNQRVRKRIEEAVNSGKLMDASSICSFESVSASFASSLNVHLNLCDMGTDNWRWHINFLEDKFQNLTRYALHASVEKKVTEETPLHAPLRSGTEPTPQMQRQWSLASAQRFLAGSGRSRTVAGLDDSRIETVRLEERRGNSKVVETDDSDFSVSKLQSIQHLEEKANETLLVMEINSNILQELSDYYAGLQQRPIWQDDFGKDTKDSISRFQNAISSSVSDLKIQRSRLSALIRMLGKRKDLLFGLLDHKNVLTNQHTSVRAQESAEKMEKLTVHMKEIALKTEEETVSMRIVTYVTLAFLPGTFVSTLMSTPILQFSANDGVRSRVFFPGAFEAWIGMTVILTAVTFLSSHLIRRQESKKAEKRRNMLDFS